MGVQLHDWFRLRRILITLLKYVCIFSYLYKILMIRLLGISQRN